ncbi:MAG: hypothetical protein HQL51_04495 [Magnetococcales bacterium]|nr:hypothetical protein [Magnetococcales bacterium]
MGQLAQRHPGYGWERNQGYPAPEHLAALQTLGITPEHRRTFGPVKRLLATESGLFLSATGSG